MSQNFGFLTLLVFFFLTIETHATQIWAENFAIPNKGFWGDTDGKTIHSDMIGISQWTLDCSACQLTADNDYVKTTSTSGGRLEAMDCDGEAVWRSEWISLEGFRDISVKMNLSETGTGKTASSKYIRVFYRIDDRPEVLFAENGEKSGDFGAAQALQAGLTGDKLQIIIRMNSSYASDKLIVDDILVEGEKDVISTASKIVPVSYPMMAVAGEKFTIEAQAADQNGLIDAVYSKAMILSEANNLIQPISVFPEKGVCRWPNLMFESEGILDLNISSHELSRTNIRIPVEKALQAIYSYKFEDGMPPGIISDGDWNVTSNQAISGTFSLQHASDAKNSKSKVFFPISQSFQSAKFRWLFKVKSGSWEASSTNRFQYFLLADQIDLQSINGWAVGTNFSGSGNTFELWRIRGGKPDSLIIQSQTAWKANSQCQIEVMKSGRGDWQLAIRNNNEEPVGMSTKGTDRKVFDFNYMGLQFDHSSARSGDLWVDDLSLTAYPEPPRVEEIIVMDDTHLHLRLNKAIELATIKTGNFSIETKNGREVQVLHAATHPLDGSIIVLSTSKSEEMICRLSVVGITDLDGRTMQPETHTFNWARKCQQYDLVINEIFADPLPSRGLAEYEYIEIHNRMSLPVQISNVSLLSGGRSMQIPDTLLSAGAFLVFSSMEGAKYFPSGIGLSGFPALRNSNGEIILKSSNLIIDQVQYSDQWYGNETYREGGWSLERIDPNRFCGVSENWTTSRALVGGTPGKQNSVKRINTDQLPPKIIYSEAISARKLEMRFSEEIEEHCLNDRTNFRLKESGQLPDSIQLSNSQQIILFFNDDFSAKMSHTIEMRQLSDLCGNQAREKSSSFVFYKPEVHSLIISEIFADPFPCSGLPENEYVEIFNRTEFPIRLQNIRLQVENKSYLLDTTLIAPGAFITLSSAEGAKMLPNGLAIKSFPALRNNAGSLALIDESGLVIDQITYSDNWYHDSEKKEGGWSLERIDNNRFCGQAGNWTASVASAGGTPGQYNSVRAENADHIPPFVTETELIGPNQLRVRYSEAMTLETVLNKENYIVLPGEILPDKVEGIDNSTVDLFFSVGFTPNESYSIRTERLTDDCSNPLKESTETFVWQQLQEGDLLISEVLFNPYPGGADFVEIYNPLQKPVNLKNIVLASRNQQNEIVQISTICSKNYWLPSGGYLACSKDTSGVLMFYHTTCSSCIAQTTLFPSFPDDNGTVVLLDQQLQVIDEFHYSEKMHHPMIDDPEGVSLERISFTSETDQASNWHSAASTTGYATPGYANSQQRNELAIMENIEISPDAFSPNNDGYNDRLFIHYQFEKPGYQANVKVYDSLGRLVNHLVKNEIIEQKGSWFWDGETQQQSRSRLGVYLVLIELFDTHGQIKKFRKACTLTDRL